MQEQDAAQVADAMADLQRRRRAERGRLLARSPKPMADVMSQVVIRRGYGRTQANRSLEDAWQEAAGETFAERTRAVRVRGGKLEVIAANSTVMQELTYARDAILARLGQLVPEQQIRDLRLRVGSLT